MCVTLLLYSYRSHLYTQSNVCLIDNLVIYYHAYGSYEYFCLMCCYIFRQKMFNHLPSCQAFVGLHLFPRIYFIASCLERLIVLHLLFLESSFSFYRYLFLLVLGNSFNGKGQQALSSINSCERSLIEVCFFSALDIWSCATFMG